MHFAIQKRLSDIKSNVVSVKTNAEQCANILGDLLALNVNTVSIEPALQRSEQVKVGVQMIKVCPNFLVDREKVVVGLCP